MKLFGALTVLAVAVAVPSRADVCLPPRPARPALANTRTAQHFITAPGTVMPDGTVFAGYTADGAMLYTTRCDAGQTWSGSACTGTALSKAWNNESSNWTTTGFTSRATGQANTAGLVALSDAGAPYQAAAYCDGLTDSGHSDWYLPAIDELGVLQANKTAIGGFNVSGSWYWSASEYSNTNACVQRFSDGLQTYVINKNNAYYVRCARR